MVQIVARHPAEAKGVQVAEGDRGEYHQRRRYLVQLGNVRVLEVELDPVHTHQDQEPERTQEEQDPQAPLDADPFISEHVRDAVESRSAGENFNRRRSLERVHHLFRLSFEIHDEAVRYQCEGLGNGGV